MEKIKDILQKNKDNISTGIQLLLIVTYVFATIKYVVRKNSKKIV